MERHYRRLLRGAVRYFARDDPEELVAEAAAVRGLDLDRLWEEFWWRHRSPVLVAGALVDAQSRGLLTVPLALQDRCEALLDASQRRFAALLAVAEHISKTLAAAGIPHRFLKGMVLTERVYPRVGGRATRLFGDIDLALDAADEVPALRALESAGFRRHAWAPGHCELLWPSERSLWEGLPVLERPMVLDPKQLWFGEHHVFVELLTGAFLGRGILRRPWPFFEDSSELHLLHACLHLMKHLIGGVVHPMALVDVALLLHRSSWSVSRFLGLTTDERTARSVVAMALGMCAGAFGGDLVPSGLTGLRQGSGFRAGKRLGAELVLQSRCSFRERVQLCWTVRLPWEGWFLAFLLPVGQFLFPKDTVRGRAARWIYNRTLRRALQRRGFL